LAGLSDVQGLSALPAPELKLAAGAFRISLEKVSSSTARAKINAPTIPASLSHAGFFRKRQARLS
jgi:hypothetical protein